MMRSPQQQEVMANRGGSFLWLALAGNLIVAGAVIFFVWQNHQDVERNTRKTIDNLVRLISQDIESEYRSIDLALRGVVDEFASTHAPKGDEIDLWLRQVRSHLPILHILRIADTRGEVNYGPEFAPGTRANIADREYFRALRDDPQAGLQISDPLAGRTTGQPVIVLARRLNDAKGHFAGVVFGSIPVDTMTAKLARLLMGPDDVIAIRNSNFRWILRYPAAPQIGVGSSFNTPAFEAALKANPDQGRYDTNAGSIDRIDRLVSFQRNATYGYYVNVGLARNDVFADWRRGAVIYSGVLALFFVVSLALVWRLRRAWRTQVIATARLQQSSALFDAASRAAKFGGWSMDVPSMQLAWTNETYRIHELEPGTPVTVEVAIGFYTEESQPLISAAVQAAIEHGTPWDLDLQLVTARGKKIWARVVGQAERVDGKTTRIYGALLDIGQQKALVDLLAGSERHLRLAAEHAAVYIHELNPAGIITYANRVYPELTHEQVVGTSIFDWFPEALKPMVRAAFERVIARAEGEPLEYTIPDPSGVMRSYEASLIPAQVGGKVLSVVLTSNEVTERKVIEQQLLDSRELLREFLDHFPGVAFIKDENLRVLMASAGFKSLLGIDPATMVGRSNEELFPGEFGQKIAADDRRVFASEATDTIEEVFGNQIYETTKFIIRQNDQRLLAGITVDVTAKVRSRQRTEALLRLSSLSGLMPERDYLREGLQMAETLTGSHIGFLHFVNEDQESIELVTWTEGALRGCQAAYDAHYPISKAGIWADCFRQKGSVVFNDYPAASGKKGLPDGHARLDRLISVPVIEEGRVRMMMGVGNKDAEYDAFDIETVQLIGNDLWRIVRRQRVEKALNERLVELTELTHKLEQAQNQLLQSEKMSTIGQLAAGVAHELNNPIGFIQSNLGTLAGYVDDLLEVLEYSDRCAESCRDSARSDALKKIKQQKDLAFLTADIRQLLIESKDGADRVRRIVQNLKDFSHVSEDEWQWTDLHKGLDSTLNLVWNEIKYKAEVEKRYGELPDVYCVGSQINQVFMNLLVNAAQAIESQGKIVLASGFETGATPETSRVWVEIRDTGKGISAENLRRIFDPFFTTKPVGQGTGLGLSLAWSIVQKHHGSLEVKSVVGEGTTFRLELPVRNPTETTDSTT